MPEVELGSQNPASREEDFEELSSNADLYVFNHQMVQVQGLEIMRNPVGDMHMMEDYMDVSNQENVAPVYFQS